MPTWLKVIIFALPDLIRLIREERNRREEEKKADKKIQEQLKKEQDEQSGE